MSTMIAPAPVAVRVAAPRDFPRPGLARLTRIELRKTSDTRSGAWLLAITALLTMVVSLLWALLGGQDERTYGDVLELALLPSAVILPVLGILLVTGEWSQRTALSTFALVPDRGRVVQAKLLAALALGVAATAVVLLVAAVATVVGGAPDAWNVGLDRIGMGTLAILLSVLWGFAFGLVLTSPAAAIVAFFALPTVFSALGEVIRGLSGTWAWVDPNRSLAELSEYTIDGTGWAQLGVACTLWILLPLAVGTVRLLRREVK